MTDHDVRAHLESLRANYVSLAARLRLCEEWIDTMSSPLWKRIWFVLQGYRWKRLGRWRGAYDSDAWPPRT